MRKNHLQHTQHGGPTCQTGRIGGSLRGEHMTYSFAEFSVMPPASQCARCAESKLFSFLKRKAAA